MNRRLKLLVLLSVCCFTGVITAYAQSPTPATVTDNDVNRVAKGLYCPVCKNVPLEVCETQACAQWREEIRGLLAQGDTDEQIRQHFVDQYGPTVIGMPSNPTAFALNVYLPYALIGLFGFGILISLLSRRRRKVLAIDATDGINTPDTPLDEYHERLEQEIRRRD